MSQQQVTSHSFAPQSKKEWGVQVLKELKGKPSDSIHWQHPELGSLEAFYHPDDQIEALELPPRSNQDQFQAWEIRGLYALSSAQNEELLADLKNGVNAIEIDLSHAEIDRLSQLLKGVHLNMVRVILKGGSSRIRRQALSIIQGLMPENERGQLKLSIAFDPITEAFDRGRTDERSVAEHCHDLPLNLAGLRALSIDAARYHEAGAGDVLELAIALHLGAQYLNELVEAGNSIDEISKHFEFELAAGQSYFVNIAKFRAFRIMWAAIVRSYKPEHACSEVCWIHARTSMRNFTMNDAENNLLRATSSAMAAVIGGCDSLRIEAFVEGDRAQEAKRYAQNIHHLLHDESTFGSSQDPSKGSHYIEALTTRVIEKTDEVLVHLENAGGIENGGSNYVREKIKDNALRTSQELQNEEIIRIGINKFALGEPRRPGATPNEAIEGELAVSYSTELWKNRGKA